jgi:hypothetical protein
MPTVAPWSLFAAYQERVGMEESNLAHARI